MSDLLNIKINEYLHVHTQFSFVKIPFHLQSTSNIKMVFTAGHCFFVLAHASNLISPVIRSVKRIKINGILTVHIRIGQGFGGLK